MTYIKYFFTTGNKSEVCFEDFNLRALYPCSIEGTFLQF